MDYRKISFLLVVILSSFVLSCQSQSLIKEMKNSYDKTFSRFLNDSMSKEEKDFANNWKSYIFKNRKDLLNYFSITSINDKSFIFIEEVDYSNGNYNSNLIIDDKVYSLSKKDYNDNPGYTNNLFFNQKIVEELRDGNIGELRGYSKNTELIDSHNSFIFTIGKDDLIETYTMDAFDLENNQVNQGGSGLH